MELTGYYDAGKKLECTIVSDYMVAITDCEMPGHVDNDPLFSALTIPDVITSNYGTFSVVRIDMDAFRIHIIFVN